MIKTSLILFAFFIISDIVGQCNNVTISTQTGMNAFNCTKVASLTITNSSLTDPITNFSNLSSLDTVTGSITLNNFVQGSGYIKFDSLKYCNNFLTSFVNTLDSIILRKVDIAIKFQILSNAGLRKIKFDSLNADIFKISGTNSSVFEVTGNLKTTNFEMTDSPIASLSFLDNTAAIENFTLKNCPNLITPLQFFNNKKSIGILIMDNCQNIDFSSLNSLVDIKYFELKNLNTLTNLNFFSNLKFINSLSTIENNINLNNLDGLNKTIHISGLSINNNPLLNNCCVLNLLLRSKSINELSLSNNGSDCSFIADVLRSCSDADNDSIENDDDNCPNTSNPSQTDDDNDGIGNACDAYPSGNDPIVEIEDASLFINGLSNGIILKGSNGQCFKVQVNENGLLVTRAVDCP